MTDISNEPGVATALAKLDAVRDVLTVKRVFGDPYEAQGVTVIPVATLRGGGGGGGGEGSGPDGQGTGSGAGLGFGVHARPVGVFAVKDGAVEWRPAIDVMRLALGCQVVCVVGLFTLGRVLTHRARQAR